MNEILVPKLSEKFKALKKESIDKDMLKTLYSSRTFKNRNATMAKHELKDKVLMLEQVEKEYHDDIGEYDERYFGKTKVAPPIILIEDKRKMEKAKKQR